MIHLFTYHYLSIIIYHADYKEQQQIHDKHNAQAESNHSKLFLN